MHSPSTAVGPRSSRRVRVALAACLALAVQACGGGGGSTPAPVDHARLDACVLVGATVAEGCTTDGADAPALQLGDMEMGQTKARVLALYNGGDGDVAATVSAVQLAPAAAANYTLSLFQVQGGVETPATLPFDLRPRGATELRVRVQLTANAAIGPVSGVSVAVTATHPETSAQVPITANVTGCPAGLGNCDDDPSNACETDLQAEVAHCGGCGNACSDVNGTPSCTDGVCGITCDAGFDNCDGGVGNGCEVDLSSDAAHCGGCAVACDTTNGTASCSAGSCAIACNAGFDDCDASAANGCEIDLQTDLTHCGACANACSTTNGTASCSAGTCAIACDTDFGDCDGDAATGCEVNLTTDVAHCGACADACSTTNATPSCTAGVCAVSCTAGFDDCDGDAATGCESELATDPLHCGGCAIACDTTNGTATCSGSTCGITCNAGFEDCDGDASNGCEVNLQTDPTHCSACATVCDGTNGTPTCSGGTCGITCDQGYTDCDGDASNGCEVSTGTDTANCGACANACDATNGTASCSAGVCGITCDSGYGDCDGDASNGCEVNLNTDTTHCGACIVACSTANGTAACTGGVCGITCDLGFDDCDANAATGCEANLLADPAHCGSCLGACSTTNGTASCTAGTCGITCDAGFQDCDGSAITGCEVNLQTDAGNCSACGAVCDATNGTAFCDAAACGITCSPGYDNCDGNAATGCESALDSDPANCAACGNACTYANATPTCVGGACALGACDAGFGDCDADPATGCEYDVSNDVLNCGACGAVCAPTANVGSSSCTGSACTIELCNSGWNDADSLYATGCECKAPVVSPNCASAQVVGNIATGGSWTGPLDGVAAGAQAYYSVTFSGIGGTPRIRFSRNDGGLAVFDVLTACGGGAYSCQDIGGGSNSLTDYQFYDSYSGSSRSYPWPASVIIRVRQKTGTTGCPAYSLYITR